MTTGAVTIWSLALVGFCVLTVVGRDLNFRAAALTAGGSAIPGAAALTATGSLTLSTAHRSAA